MAITENELNPAQNEVVSTQIPEIKDEVENSTIPSKKPVFDGDIDLSATRKKEFRINGDDRYILKLNTSDMSVLKRLEANYGRLERLTKNAALKQVMKNDDSSIGDISAALEVIDKEMREIIDNIFDSNVSEVCAPYGSMYDPFNGKFRYEHIIEKLFELYERNIETEFKKINAKMAKRTGKYTKRK